MAGAQGDPTGTLAVGAILRHNVGREHVVDRGAVMADRVGTKRVRIVLARAVAVPLNGAIATGNLEGNADTRDDVRVIAVGLTGNLEIDTTARKHGVDKLDAHAKRTDGRSDALAHGNDDRVAVLLPRDTAGGRLHHIDEVVLPQGVILLGVVVDERMPETNLGTGGHDVATGCLPLAHGTVDLAEGQLAVEGVNADLLLGLLDRKLGTDGSHDSRCRVIGDGELAHAQLEHRLAPGVGSHGVGAHGEQSLACGSLANGQGQLDGLAGSDRSGHERLAAHHVAVHQGLRHQADILEGGKPTLVGDGQLARLRVIGHANRADDLAVLGQARARLLPGEHHAVDAEVAVVGIVAVVATIHVVGHAVLGHSSQTVIAPLPDKLALDAIPTIEDLLVLGQASRAVAHGVAVLAVDARLGERMLAKVVHLRHAGIHGGDDVDGIGVAVLLVVDRAAVELVGLGIHRADIAAITALVAHRPHDDARMVALLHHQALDTVDISRLPRRIVGNQGNVADVLETVALHIGLGHQHDAVLVTQLVEARVVGIVRSAHRVDVVLLHELKVAAHAIETHGAALVVIVIVAVDAVHLKVGAVEVDMVALDGDLGETLTVGHVLADLVAVVDLKRQVVEEGVLGVPEVGIGNGALGVTLDALARGNHVLAVAERKHDAACALGNRIERNHSGIALAVRAEPKVDQVRGRTLHKVHIAEDARGPPHVLVLDIAAVAVLKDLNGKQVIALDERVGHVELGGQARALGHADKLAVDVQLAVALDAVEANDLASAGGDSGKVDDALVNARGVIGGNKRLIDREREALVGVGELTVAVHLPQVRNLDVVPLGLVGRKCLVGDGGRALKEAELPRAGQLDKSARKLAAVRSSEIGGLVTHKVRMGCQAVPVGERLVFPIVNGVHGDAPSSS